MPCNRQRTSLEYASMVEEGIRNKVLKRSALTGIASNAFLAVLKLAIGLISGSVAIVSDAANNLSDMLSSIVTIVVHVGARGCCRSGRGQARRAVSVLHGSAG